MSGDDSIKDLSKSEMERILERAEDIALHSDKNGSLNLEYRSGGVYLTVFPPKGGGIPLKPGEVMEEVRSRRVRDADQGSVQKAAMEMNGSPVLIAPPQDQPVEDGRVLVELSKNKMEAYLTTFLPGTGGKPVTREMIENALREKNVVYGIKKDVINMAADKQNSGETMVVAVGSEPVNGEDAVINFKCLPDAMTGKPEELMDGRVDFYNLHFIHNVQPGDVLAVKSQATKGQPGFTVTGEELPAKPGKDIQIMAGKNVELSQDNLTAIATGSGHASIQGNKISVSNVYEVSGNVDFNTGNIDFNGSVVVKGSIREGFKVVADGDVEVMDTISDGIVECTGTLKVRNGIIGRSKSRITAGGSIYTRFIENSIIDAGGDIMVGEAIMHSHVSARKTIVVAGKGVIVGGLVRAGREINCKVAGSTMATVTELETGVNPELRRRHSALYKEKQAKEADLDKADKAVKLLNYLEQTQGSLPEDKKAIYIRVSRMKSELTNEIQEMTRTIRDLEERIQASEQGRVVAQGVIHPGVKVTIGSASIHIYDDHHRVCLVKVGPDIRINPA